jgi:hypothetical protein
MERTAKHAAGLYLCSRCRLHAFDTLSMKLEHERTCTPVNDTSEVQLHRSVERRKPEWLDDAPTPTEEAHGSTPVSRQVTQMLARAGVTL